MTCCVIIPAHNEANVIERTLLSLLKQAGEEFQIVVACNGCSDNTAAIARKFSPRVRVIETDVPSKTNALNLADAVALGFPRIYLDADITLSDGALQHLTRALTTGPFLAVSPSPVMDFSGSNWAVRAYYQIWLSMPYAKRGLLGAGVYALSEAGRSRFNQFPDIIADDGYVRALFKEQERGRVPEAIAYVKAPASLYWLMKIKTRSRLGVMQLKRRFPELCANEEKNYSGALSDVLRSPGMWIKFLVYLYVNLLSRIHAKRRLAQLESYRWEKDVSSRQA